jgi:hypothetical protein
MECFSLTTQQGLACTYLAIRQTRLYKIGFALSRENSKTVFFFSL